MVKQTESYPTLPIPGANSTNKELIAILKKLRCIVRCSNHLKFTDDASRLVKIAWFAQYSHLRWPRPDRPGRNPGGGSPTFLGSNQSIIIFQIIWHPDSFSKFISIHQTNVKIISHYSILQKTTRFCSVNLKCCSKLPFVFRFCWGGILI